MKNDPAYLVAKQIWDEFSDRSGFDHICSNLKYGDEGIYLEIMDIISSYIRKELIDQELLITKRLEKKTAVEEINQEAESLLCKIKACQKWNNANAVYDDSNVLTEIEYSLNKIILNRNTNE